jgi:hypothetical protein
MWRLPALCTVLMVVLFGVVIAAEGPAAPPYEIPRLDNISIDGNPGRAPSAAKSLSIAAISAADDSVYCTSNR